MKEKRMLWIGLGVVLILILIVAAIFLFGNTKGQKEDAGNKYVVESLEDTIEETPEETAETIESTEESIVETEATAEETEETAGEESEVEEKEETQESQMTPSPTPKPTEKPSPTPSVQSIPSPTPEVIPEPTKEPVATPEESKEPVTLPAPEPTPEPSAPEHTHAWVENWMFTPTCGQQGYVTVKCSLCNAIDEERSGDVAPLGHTIEGYIIDEGDCVSPSCTAYRCTVCGAENVQPTSLSVGPGQPDAHAWEESKELIFDEELFDFVEVPIVKCDRCNARKE